MAITKMISDSIAIGMLEKSRRLEEMSSDVRTMMKVADRVASDVSDGISKSLKLQDIDIDTSKFMDIFVPRFKDAIRDSLSSYVRKHK